MEFNKLFREMVLVFGGGGGGDVATSAFIALKLRSLGCQSYIACTPWERFSVDPNPGPISFNNIKGGTRIGRYSMAVDGNSYAIRGGSKIVFQAVNISSVLNEPVYICDLNTGVKGVANCLTELVKYLNVDLILGVDVGGDILAEGFEDDLWSPLADQIMLSALYRVESSNTCRTLIGVASIGSDGELSREYILERLSIIAGRGGLIGSIGFGYNDLEYMDRILSKAITEAGRAIPDAIRGFRGFRFIRGGSRRIYIDPISTIVFLLDTCIVYDLSRIARLIIDTESIEDANRILVDHGVFTELELEKRLYELLESCVKLDSKIILDIKKSWIKSRRRH